MRTILLIFVCIAALQVNAQFDNYFSLESGGINSMYGGFGVADIDGDGKLDFIFSGSDGREQDVADPAYSGIFINNGDRTFTKRTTPNVINPGKHATIKPADLNGDGKIDFLFNGYGGKIGGVAIEDPRGLALNDGTGDFYLLKNTMMLPAIEGQISCAVADFNNDGLLDFVVTGGGPDITNPSLSLGKCAVFFQLDDGTFIKDNSSFTGFSLKDPDVTVVDINNDGYMDIFITGYDIVNKLRFSTVFLNDGTGKFAPMAQPNIIRKGHGSADWADINGDGWMDLIFYGYGGPDGEATHTTARLYKNNEGTLEVAATFAKYLPEGISDDLRFVDWNNTGNMDLIISGWNETHGVCKTHYYKCTDPENFTFQLQEEQFFPGVKRPALELADLDGDGKTDLLIAGMNLDVIGGAWKNIAGVQWNTTANAKVLPAAPVNLKHYYDKDFNIILEWDEVPNIKGTKSGITYNLALKNKTTGKWFYYPMSVMEAGENNGKRLATGKGNVLNHKKWKFNYLPPQEKFEWTVQAIDGSFQGGSFAPLMTFNSSELTFNNINSPDGSWKPQITVNGTNVTIKSTGYNTASIYSSTGKLLEKQSFTEEYTTTLVSGIYIISILDGKQTFNEKAFVGGRN